MAQSGWQEVNVHDSDLEEDHLNEDDDNQLLEKARSQTMLTIVSLLDKL